MKRYEFYIKYKASRAAHEKPLLSKRNWWQIALISIIAIVTGPLNVYRRQRSIPVATSNYLRLVEYFSFIIIPLVALLLWSHWREYLRRSRGYNWIGRFEVVNKRSSFLFYYLLLAPGNSELKVNRNLFGKTSVGDCVVIRRDALGKIEEISRVDKFSSLVARAKAKRFSDPSKSVETSNLKFNTGKDLSLEN